MELIWQVIKSLVTVPVLEIVSAAAAIIAAFSGAILFAWIYRGLMPVLDVRIIPRWVDEVGGLLIIRLEVENKSKVGVKKKLARFQILQHHIPDAGCLSEWVPFEEPTPVKKPKPGSNTEDRCLDSETLIKWRKPHNVLESTKKIESKETVAVERLYCPPSNVALHCGFQFIADLNVMTSLANRLGIRTDRWTTTIWVKQRTVVVQGGNPNASPGVA